MVTVCVYCGSSDKMSEAYLQVALQMGGTIARRGFVLAYGAGRTGMMGAVADGALEAGGEVIGVIPKMFATPTLMHNGLSKLEIVDTMHTRKQRLVDISDAFIALPGGYGTFEELFEILTWAQIGLHHKPVGMLNTLHYFDPLLSAIEYAQTEGFMYAEHSSLFVVADQPDVLLDMLMSYQYPQGMEKWLTRHQ
ncbi:MAG: Rossman fold protein, TIGR00730 family [Chloroflexi bacterium RBG_19FT_COMBO_50_10]|nr:MAG: Rossman fold protein, TIGR00730 family [Chloroflexi bacterium RBG_19FT_COMBO_50_10]